MPPDSTETMRDRLEASLVAWEAATAAAVPGGPVVGFDGVQLAGDSGEGAMGRALAEAAAAKVRSAARDLATAGRAGGVDVPEAVALSDFALATASCEMARAADRWRRARPSPEPASAVPDTEACRAALDGAVRARVGARHAVAELVRLYPPTRWRQVRRPGPVPTLVNVPDGPVRPDPPGIDVARKRLADTAGEIRRSAAALRDRPDLDQAERATTTSLALCPDHADLDAAIAAWQQARPDRRPEPPAGAVRRLLQRKADLQ